jgi:hypothetical protein
MHAFLFMFNFKFPSTWRPFIFETLCVSLMLQKEQYHHCGGPGSIQGQSICSMANKVPTGQVFIPSNLVKR